MFRSCLILTTAAAILTACSPKRDAVATVGTPTSFSFPYVDPTIPDAPKQFGGGIGEPSRAPSIVYPLSGAMHPVNIGAITFQWNRGDASSRVFRIRLDDGQAFYDFYVPCTL